ncbi:MAG: hypothetical protein IJB35_01010 [Oscillospiraceae bacterium]|nr:hypothetical protein [Oscillospiraceae bacterium]
MKKYIAICLALTIILTSFTGCIADIAEEFGFSNQAAQNNTRETKIDTAYPDDISTNGANVITVEDAEYDLRRHNYYNELINNGVITFDKKLVERTNRGEPVPVYYFNIAVQREYAVEHYTAKVKYVLSQSESNAFEYQSCDIDTVPEFTFTKMGVYQYSDSNTSIWINFIESNGVGGYTVEYEIAYYAQKWSSGGWVVSSSDGKTGVGGSRAWDGEKYYLSIDLGEFYGGEDDEEKSRGRIEVYPEKGVYWDALHANGPYKLSN